MNTAFPWEFTGDNTEAKFNEFKSKLEAAGLDKVTEAMKTQYEAFAAQ